MMELLGGTDSHEEPHKDIRAITFGDGSRYMTRHTIGNRRVGYTQLEVLSDLLIPKITQLNQIEAFK